jgi:L-aminopeptidase/D-esterase-like protein
VATTAAFSKAELAKLAQMAQDGLALAIRPSHTPFDGDTVFALSTSRRGASGASGNPLSLSIAGAIGAQLVARAIAKAVRAATGLQGVPAWRDLPFAQ